ncbi:MAG: hypothetical protein L0H73_13245, partial [Nitrococcus sp.]|nr:hypothetical protein [Nitrococcus sp.]
PSKKALNDVPKGAEPNDEKALNEVQSNSPYNYPRNSPVKIKHAGPVKKRKRKPELDLSRAVYLIGEAATADLLEYRRSIKKPLKQQGLNLLARKIQTASEENDMPTVDIVAEMDAAGWQGFEPHWLANRLSDGGNHEQNGRDRSSRNGKQAAVDRLLEANRRYVEQRGDAPISEPFSHC